jgi:hypothetical protein
MAIDLHCNTQAFKVVDDLIERNVENEALLQAVLYNRKNVEQDKCYAYIFQVG